MGFNGGLIGFNGGLMGFNGGIKLQPSSSS